MLRNILINRSNNIFYKPSQGMGVQPVRLDDETGVRLNSGVGFELLLTVIQT